MAGKPSLQNQSISNFRVIYALCRQDLADWQHRNAGGTVGDHPRRRPPGVHPPCALHNRFVNLQVPATFFLEKESIENQFSPGLQHPNTTELAGFMKVNDTRSGSDLLPFRRPTGR
jgi:hypothetical protein